MLMLRDALGLRLACTTHIACAVLLQLLAHSVLSVCLFLSPCSAPRH